ncbi:hypothetical protein DDO73_17120 [Vibrio cholerae]|nr:hypothetical protein [Vibrio cholerae]HAS7807684.1 hypothetical protein [Vibrio cholerae]
MHFVDKREIAKPQLIKDQKDIRMNNVVFLNPITLALKKIKPVVVCARHRLRKGSDLNGLDPRSSIYMAHGIADDLNRIRHTFINVTRD